ncbi:hypothetical protein HY490_03330 [Candidatus Woesearchaeota archaeon]|nr:hypothetical protein [Candidatus Woesearchaeota archaeon]
MMLKNEQDPLELARQEMKRADHLLYVSLKYTRTVDVLKSIVERLINAYDASVSAALERASEQKKIDKIPQLPRQKLEIFKTLYPANPDVLNYCELYLILRKIANASFDRSNEYRRHVTMTAHVDDEQIEITIDIIKDYFDKTQEFVSFVEKLLA